MVSEGLLNITCKVLLQPNYKGGERSVIVSYLSPVVLKPFPKLHDPVKSETRYWICCARGMTQV